jgi:hypothetical protein
MDGRKLHACEINIVLIIWKLGQPSAAWRNVNFELESPELQACLPFHPQHL